MLVIMAFVATLSAGIFCGAALYITLVEHPVRSLLDTAAALSQWAPSYQRATLMQAPLAIVSCVSGIAVWLSGGTIMWLVAALLIGMVIPFTLIVVMRTNHLLLAKDRDPHSVETRRLLDRWGRLHAVRTVLSTAAVVLMLWQLITARG